MKGKIVKILENDYGQEYGFIRRIDKEESDYYFDNRYLLEGAMSDFYIDDIVDFEPSINPYKSEQKVAKAVALDMGAIEQQPFVPQPASEKQPITNQYYPPEQKETISKNWYKHGPPPKSVQLTDFSNEEVLNLQKMQQILYHTNAGHFRTREMGINYGYSLFGPTKNFAIQLGLEKVEFAMIFCDKDDFQRRTLEETFPYLTHYVIPKVRISGHFYVLATKCNDIVSQIEKPEIQGALPYSIIPFSYAELLNEPEESFETFVLTRFKKHLFERDFFSYSEPIKDRLFLFGSRDSFAKQIADRCSSGDHSGIFGLRKSGKTSVINMIKQELEQRSIFYLSYRCVEFLRHDWNKAVYKIIKDIYLKAGMIPPSPDYSEEDAIERFNSDLAHISKEIGNKIVLIFDEIEQIAVDTSYDDKWQSPVSIHLFWSTFVKYCEDNPGSLALVIAGINPSINETYFVQNDGTKTAPRNPMYKKLANENYLKPFVFEQTKRMVNELGKYMGFHFTDETCYELQKDFGGHPFFTRQMCKVIVEHVKAEGLKTNNMPRFEVERSLYYAVKESKAYVVQYPEWCKDILLELRICYPDEFNLLLQIANGDKSAKSEVQKNTNAIQHLIGYGLVKYDPASREMEISIDIVRDYLVNQGTYKKPYSEMTQKEIDEEIQDGIRKCEQPLRNLILSVLSVSFTPVEAADFIRETKTFKIDNRQKDISTYSAQQLMDPRLVTLHFYALKDIICSTDPRFGDHFEKFKFKLYPLTKAEVQSYLSNIYVARNAADHHYEVHNEGTLNNFRSSLNEMLKVINK